MSSPDQASELYAMVRRRYGDRLTPEQLEEVRIAIQHMLEAGERLRSVPLANADEPLALFQPYRAPEP